MNNRAHQTDDNAEPNLGNDVINFLKTSIATGAQAGFATACGYPARTYMSGVVKTAHLPYLQQPMATFKNAWPLISQGKGFGLNLLRGTPSLFLLTGTNALMKHYVGTETPLAKAACFVASVIPGTAMALMVETRFIRATTPSFGPPLDLPGKIFSPNYYSLRLAGAYLGRESLFVATVLSENLGVLTGSSLGTSSLQRVIVLEANRDRHNISLKPQPGQGALNAAATICPPNMVLGRFAYMGSLLVANTLWAKVSSLGLFKKVNDVKLDADAAYEPTDHISSP